MSLRALVFTCALCIALVSPFARAGARVPALHDIEVVADRTFYRGAPASVHVATFAAKSLNERMPLAGAEIKVELVHRPSHTQSGTQGAANAKTRQPPQRIELARLQTGTDGTIAPRFIVPRDLPTGRYELVISSTSQYGSEVVRKIVDVEEAIKLHLRTDRDKYQAGHTVHWRAIAFNAANAHPMSNAEITVALMSGDTALWRGAVKTDATGMVSGAFPLASDAALGAYTISAKMQDTEEKVGFEVRTYRLPPFRTSIELNGKGPFAAKDTISGTIVAQYLHGEPVSGSAVVKTHWGAAIAQGTLDAHGRLPFSLKLEEERDLLVLKASVTADNGRVHAADLDVPVASGRLEVAVIPETAKLAAGKQQWVTVLTTDGAGRFTPAAITMSAEGMNTQTLRSPGAVRVPVTLSGTRTQLEVRAQAGDRGAVNRTSISLRDPGRPAIRLAEAVVPAGEAIELEGMWPGALGPVTVTLLRHGAPVATAVAKVAADGRLSARIVPPPGVFGLATVRATDLRWETERGELSPAIAQASLYLYPAMLSVSVAGTGRFRPGDTARLGIEVRDKAGAPAPGVGVAASVIDERALMLSESKPDLVEVLRNLDVGRAEAAGILFRELLAQGDKKVNRVAMRALIEALPNESIRPEVHSTTAARLQSEITRIGDLYELVHDELVNWKEPVGMRRKEDGQWTFAMPFERVLAAGSIAEEARKTPWGDFLSWEYVTVLNENYAFAKVVSSIADARLHLLAHAVYTNRAMLREKDPLAKMAARGKVGRHLLMDPWGTKVKLTRVTGLKGKRPIYQLIAAGPDLVFDTDDDIVLDDVLLKGQHWYGSGYGSGTGGGSLGGRLAGVPSVRIGSAELGPLPLEGKVRKRFDQTVLWASGLITDERGQIQVEVPLADSITGWQVAVEALGPQGGVGSARARLETALPMYVSADMPAYLTVGDRYTVPVVLANHSGKARKFGLRVEVRGSLTMDKSSRQARVELPSGTTQAVPVTLRATKSGTGTLALALIDESGAAVDRVEESVEVRPPGNVVRSVHTATGEDSTLRVSFTVPENSAPGSMAGELRLFRGAADQVMDGLEGMLREPHGCFEQTSSATYPNLLILRLLDDSARYKEARRRAYELVGKGYQRLVSFEARKGGFSWFGEEPGNQVLTAYGLMEFTDMAAVYPVDPKLIERTRKWLISKQRKDGSWSKDDHWVSTASKTAQGTLLTTAYITWALVESGYRGEAAAKGLGYLRKSRKAVEKSAYLSVLWVAIEGRMGNRPAAALDALARHGKRDKGGLMFEEDGEILFFASGRSASVHATALAVMTLGMLRQSGTLSDIQAAQRWLWAARSPRYGWGDTQSTVLALRAAALTMAPGKQPRSAQVSLDGKPLASLDLESVGVPMLALPAELARGRHELVITGPRKVMADIRLRWRESESPRPVAAGIEVTLSSSTFPVKVGQHLDMQLALKNPGATPVAMPTVVLPVPPGFRASAEALEALVKRGMIEKFEDLGSQIHLYMTKLDSGQTVTMPYRLEAEAACEVTHAPAHAYAYYDPTVHGSSNTLRLTAEPISR